TVSTYASRMTNDPSPRRAAPVSLSLVMDHLSLVISSLVVFWGPARSALSVKCPRPAWNAFAVAAIFSVTGARLAIDHGIITGLGGNDPQPWDSGFNAHPVPSAVQQRRRIISKRVLVVNPFRDGTADTSQEFRIAESERLPSRGFGQLFQYGSCHRLILQILRKAALNADGK